MEETKIILPADTMKYYEELKKSISNPLVLLDYKRNPVSFTQEFIAYNNNEIRYYYAVYNLRLTTKGVPCLYSLRHNSFSFDLNKKKFKYINIQSIPLYAVETINNILKVEWFTSLNQFKNYIDFPIRLLCKKSILTKVWSKSITNPEDLMKFYFRNIVKLKNISWKNAKDFIRKNRVFDSSSLLFFLKESDEWVENPNMFIEKILKLNAVFFSNYSSSYSDYIDYLTQISVLKIRSNVAYWSKKRFIMEHNKLSDKFMELSLESKSKEDLFDKSFNDYLPKNIKCSFITNECECFKEGSYMHNCIYTNYWNKIKELSYFAISIDDEVYGRALLGIYRIRKNSDYFFKVDQIKGIRNSECNEELSNLMIDWVENNQKLFQSIVEKESIKQLSLAC